MLSLIYLKPHCFVCVVVIVVYRTEFAGLNFRIPFFSPVQFIVCCTRSACQWCSFSVHWQYRQRSTWINNHAQIAIDTVLSFRCAIGYKMYGPSQVKCTDKGQWSESFPRCEYSNVN
ncbi:hypothetical protein TYRP_001243 [Tyrophagus putrescentiae]|nr:hypothetical protein TYRP_001243 [Tyrophagus putrescentiae]